MCFVKGLSSPHLKSATAQSPKKALKPHNEYKSSEDICWCSSLLSLFKQFYYKLLPHPSFPHGHSAQLGSHRTCSWREVCPFSSEPRTENGKAAWLRTYGKKNPNKNQPLNFEPSSLHTPFSRGSHCKLIMFLNIIGHCLPTALGAATCWGCSARRQLLSSLWFTAHFLTFSGTAEALRLGATTTHIFISPHQWWLSVV